MNPDAIEAALLSGKPLQPPPNAPDRQNTEHDPEAGLNQEEDEEDDDDDDSLFTDSHNSRSRRTVPTAGPDPQAVPFANAQGRQTGVKGVLDDRRASALASQRAQAEERAKRGADQAARAMVGMTIHEEDEYRKNQESGQRESAEDAEARERWRRARRHELEREKVKERAEEGMKRGGLREVAKEGFLGAVERRGWVVVLIYEPSILRCQELLASLLALSLTHPYSPATLSGPATPVSLFRARASALKFSMLAPGSATASGATTLHEDEDDEAGQDDDEEQLDGQPKGMPDPDVLPTMLAYRDGELIKTWVRVDWEMGQEGVEGLLRREGVIGETKAGRREEQESDEGED